MVTVHVKGEFIPESIQCDLSSLEPGDRVRWDDLYVPPTMRLVGRPRKEPPNIVICNIHAKQSLLREQRFARHAAEKAAEERAAAQRAAEEW